MAAFEYEAIDGRGRTVRGVMEGDDERRVRGVLRARDLIPLRVAPIPPEGAGPRSWGLPTALKPAVLALLTRQLAILVHAGLPLEECLLALTEQSESQCARRILAAVRTQVREGVPLAPALGGFPHSFPPLYRHLVEAGEQSGTLPQVLERLADYTEQRQRLVQTIGLACLYPALVTVVALAIVSGLLVYVVPPIARVFVDSGAPLPWATRTLIAISHTVQAGGLWGPLVLAAIAGVVYGTLRDRQRRRRWQQLVLRMPLIGTLTRSLHTAHLTSTLGILTSSGIPLLAALETAAQVVTNIPMREAVEAARQRVRAGGRLSRALGQTQLVPPLVVHLIGSGEASGSLDVMLMRAAEAQGRELQRLVTVLTSLIEPVLIVVMGGILLFIALAILLPIFDMNALIR